MWTQICIILYVMLLFPTSTATEASLSQQRQMTRFGNVGQLYEGASSMDRLARSHCVAVGLGGVGSWAVEALVRSGIGHVTLVDADDVCESNINRQLHALSSTVGKMKCDALKARLLDINPDVQVSCMYDFVTPETVDDVLTGAGAGATDCGRVDYVLDMVDSVRDKAAIVHACGIRGIPVITCGGVGDLVDPGLLVVSDMARAHGDLLIQKTRKFLRQEMGWPRGSVGKRASRKWNVLAVHTTPTNFARGGVAETLAGEGRGGFRRCDTVLGNAAFVTGTCGFLMAAAVVSALASSEGPIHPVVPQLCAGYDDGNDDDV